MANIALQSLQILCIFVLDMEKVTIFELKLPKSGKIFHG